MAFGQPAGSSIKSIQRATVYCASATTGTVTITSVDTTKSVVLFSGSTAAHASGEASQLVALSLTNSTTVTGYRLYSSAAHTSYAMFQVVEYN